MTDQPTPRRSARLKTTGEDPEPEPERQHANDPSNDFPYVWRDQRKFRDNAKSAEKKFVDNKRKHFQTIGITSIPDQGGIEVPGSFLMQMKEKFQERVKIAFTAWTAMVEEWEKKGYKPIDVGLEFRAYCDYWSHQGISIINFFEASDGEISDEEWLKDFAEKMEGKTKFEEIDIRYWKVLYSRRKMSPAERTSPRAFRDYKGPMKSLAEHLWPVAIALYDNLQHILPPQADGYVPVLSELGFLAHGTWYQWMHSDYPVLVWDNGVETYIHPPDVDYREWYGSGLYYFKDDLPLSHGPLLLREPPNLLDNEGKLIPGKRTQFLHYTQQKFITFFGPHIKHAGGRNWEMVRLHVHFDPKKDKQRLPARVMRCDALPPQNVSTVQMLMKKKEKNHQEGGIASPHMFEGLYEAGTFRVTNDPREFAKTHVRKAKSDLKEQEKRAKTAKLKAPPKPPPAHSSKEPPEYPPKDPPNMSV